MQDPTFYDQLRSLGGGPLPAVPLERLLALVTASSGKRFLIDPRIPQNVLGLGDDVPTTLSYGALLSILRNNGFATVEIDGVVNIIPDSDMRHQPLPVVQEDERDRPADEWITRVIETRSVEAAQLVPILRPLIPVGGHLAALPPNHLIIVDRYVNVRRIAAIVAELDEQRPAQR
jgi:general secretion pathway protein D